MNGNRPDTLRALAEQCRKLARGASTPEVAASLADLATEYDAEAAAAEARAASPLPSPANPAG